MAWQYLPVLVFALVSLAFGIGALVFALLIRPSKPEATKSAAYECGIESKGDTRGRISIHYYIIAVIFIIFDVETIFLLPWAVKYDVLGLFGLVEMTLFIFILVLAYIYAWRKGALEWVFSDETFGSM